MDVLQFSNINAIDFANHLYDSLDKGRGKFRNIILVGESNCAKTFMFKPTAKIFGDSLFENPAHDKYCWVGADSANVILLQDFRYSREIIFSWSDFLILLKLVKLPAPKNHHATDVITCWQQSSV